MLLKFLSKEYGISTRLATLEKLLALEIRIELFFVGTRLMVKDDKYRDFDGI